MGLITEYGGSIGGYEAVPVLLPDGTAGLPAWDGALLRRRTTRPSRRALLYVHALDDPSLTADQVTWYTDRGFHLYVADLRAAGAEPPGGWGGPEPVPVSPHGSRAGEAGGIGGGPAADGTLGPGVGGAGLDVERTGPGAGDAGPGDRAGWDTAIFDAVTLDQEPPATASRGGTGWDAGGGPAGQWGTGHGTGPGGARPGGTWQRGARRGGARHARPGDRGPGYEVVGHDVTGYCQAGPDRPGRDRVLSPEVSRAAEELRDCFMWLDAVAGHLREAEAIDTLVVAAHSAGALVAALWAHARRGSQPLDALILANPDLGGAPSWLARMRAVRAEKASGRRPSPLLAGARRRIRRGLDISCPVLVMCPAGGEGPGGRGGLLGLRLRPGGRVPMRLGAHVTWLSLAGGLPGQSPGGARERREFFEELTRWLGAYLSAQIRDQLL